MAKVHRGPSPARAGRAGNAAERGRACHKCALANYNIHFVLKYLDPQSNERKNPVFLWSFNPSLFFGFFPFVLLEYLRKKRDFPLRKEVSEAYKRLKSTVDKCLSMSGYSEVNLGKLFTGSIGRSVGESSNERQWWIKNRGRLVPCLSVMISSAMLYFQYVQWCFNNLVSLEEEKWEMKTGCMILVDMKYSRCFYLPFLHWETRVIKIWSSWFLQYFLLCI